MKHTRESVLKNDSLVELFQADAIKHLVKNRGVSEARIKQLIETQDPKFIDYLVNAVKESAEAFAIQMNKAEAEEQQKGE